MQEGDVVLASVPQADGKSGLLSDSLIRLGFLAALPLKSVMGSIGAISRERHRRLLATLISYLAEAR
jgi:mRNA interferase MazF